MCSEVGAIGTAVKYMLGSLADSMLTGITNSSRIDPVFVGSEDCQVIEYENEVNIVLALLTM